MRLFFFPAFSRFPPLFSEKGALRLFVISSTPHEKIPALRCRGPCAFPAPFRTAVPALRLPHGLPFCPADLSASSKGTGASLPARVLIRPRTSRPPPAKLRTLPGIFPDVARPAPGTFPAAGLSFFRPCVPAPAQPVRVSARRIPGMVRMCPARRRTRSGPRSSFCLLCAARPALLRALKTQSCGAIFSPSAAGALRPLPLAEEKSSARMVSA